MGGRTYNPETLQFLQEDSYLGDITDVLSLNQYAYCKGNPLRYIDPTGHTAEESQDGLSLLFSVLNNIFSFIDSLFNLGDNPVAPVNSKVQNEIQSQSKHLTAKMPSNFLDKLQEALNPSDSAIKAGGIIFGIGLVAFSVALTATNPIVGAMLMNAGMSVGLQVITDCLEGNKSSVKSLATTAAVSAASGAVGGMVSSLAAGMTSNFVVATVAGASASAENATLQFLTTGKVDAKEVIISGAIGFGVGYITSSIKSNPKAKLDETASLNKNAVVIEKKEISFNPEEGYDSFTKLKKVLGPAGDNKEWHHIVEQSQTKASRSNFDVRSVNHPDNMVAIDKDVHQKISNYYSSKQSVSGDMVFRDYLNGKSFEEQYIIGKDILEKALKGLI